jgi:hypothetical protein
VFLEFFLSDCSGADSMILSVPSSEPTWWCQRPRRGRKDRAMMIIGCDFHTRSQPIAMLDEATGELTQRRLDQQSGEAEVFYRILPGPVRMGIEATGPIRGLDCSWCACARSREYGDRIDATAGFK